MVDWDKYSIQSDIDGTVCIICINDGISWSSGWCTPTLALLKALAHQEGLEVK
jgi:hypothetical protein